jgi:hypothetical protein
LCLKNNKKKPSKPVKRFFDGFSFHIYETQTLAINAVPLSGQPLCYTETTKLRKDAYHVRCFVIVFNGTDVAERGV